MKANPTVRLHPHPRRFIKKQKGFREVQGSVFEIKR